MKQEIEAGNIVFGPDERRIPSIRRNIFEKDDQVLRSVIFSYAQKASQDFAAMFDGQAVFQNPKSYRDLHRLVTYLTAPGETIVDFFAGSGTTGHGTLLANTDASSSRRFILVQLQELLDANDKDQKLAADFCASIGRPPNLAEITKERLRRAAEMIRVEVPGCSGDLGFRVFKLAPSNIRAWEADPADLESSLLKNADHLLQGRNEQDVLYELLLKLGLDLCVPIEAKTMAGKAVHSVGGGALIVCLADGLTKDVIEPLASGIVAWRAALAPAVDTRVVFKDSGFGDDIAKTNMAAILNQNGITDVRSL
jgi:adenine-specific DNA-methyltransferase